MQARVQRLVVARIALTFFVMASTTPLACKCGKAGRHTTTLVPSAMLGSGPQTKEPDGGVTLWGNGSLESAVPLEKGPVLITLVARGMAAAGDWPQVYIRLESRLVASVTIDAVTSTAYTVQVDAPHPGTSRLSVSLVNHVAVPGKPLEGRNLLVQKVLVRQRQ